MKFITVILLSLSFLNALAHDEGHGPALKDESLHGGKISAIINAKEVSIGRKAKMLYKGELLHESRGRDVKVYIYDQNMKPIKLSQFDKQIKAVQIERGKEKNFSLKLDKSGNFYQGKRPKNKRVPFNIDIKLEKGKTELFGAFDGLD